MLKKSSNISFPNLPRTKQESESYCGPAVLQMLLGFYGKKTTQKQIVKIIGHPKRIDKHGVTVEELAKAAKKLFPDITFWYKRQSSIEELSKVINTYHHPIGVEWQGLFNYQEARTRANKSQDNDAGHYSIVTNISLTNNFVHIADPYKYYAGKGKDRRFSVLSFRRRWWDINEKLDRRSKTPKKIDDYHMMFLVTPKAVIFPQKLKMHKA